MLKSDFVVDIEAIRKRAREHMEEGPVTGSYKANRESVLKILNDALATEIICVLRYKRHHYMAKGINHEPIADEFLKHAQEEEEHADRIAVRIVQLGGEADFNPGNLTERSHSQYVEGSDLIEMIKEDLIAERIAIDTYREIIRYLGEKDPTTRRLMEEILEKEEEHADELGNFLSQYGSGDNGVK
ncbi:MAG: bacterioferritin [Candidatus Melainabacteria bacterium]|nr:MAG: bacterioferritin [Candidatus Melainabacteria bacterium]